MNRPLPVVQERTHCPSICRFNTTCPDWIQAGVAPMWGDAVQQPEHCWRHEFMVKQELERAADGAIPVPGPSDPKPALIDRPAPPPEPAVVVPDAKQSSCRSCQAPIIWVKTPRGKNMPLDLSETNAPGTIRWIVGVDRSIRRALEGEPGRESHFSTCPNASQHRKSTTPKERTSP